MHNESVHRRGILLSTGFAENSGVNVVGYLSGNLGLGVLARNVMTLLCRLGVPTASHDLDSYAGKEKDQVPAVGSCFDDGRNLPYDISMFIAPPPTLFWLISEKPELFSQSGRLNVAYSAWELMVLPEPWKRALELFDVVVGCSDFNWQIFSCQLSTVPVIVGRPPMYIPSGIFPNRERFGLPSDKTIFVFSFDPASDIARKNPCGAVEAFQAAFKSESRALLVINVNNAQAAGQEHSGLADLYRRCAGDARIRVLAENFSYSDTLRLYASCDVYVSLHRSEGLGLGLMEAMALGKPVIATGWSGNMSFMDHTSACLVGYNLVRVSASTTHKYYKAEFLGEDTMWAEPRLQEASAWMRKLVNESPLRVELGEKAKRFIARYQDETEQGQFLDQIMAICRNRHLWGDLAFERSRKLQNLRTAIGGESSFRQRATRRVRQLVDRHVAWRFK